MEQAVDTAIQTELEQADEEVSVSRRTKKKRTIPNDDSNDDDSDHEDSDVEASDDDGDQDYIATGKKLKAAFKKHAPFDRTCVFAK